MSMTKIEARALLDAAREQADVQERVIVEAFYVLGEIDEFQRYRALDEIASRDLARVRREAA